ERHSCSSLVPARVTLVTDRLPSREEYRLITSSAWRRSLEKQSHANGLTIVVAQKAHCLSGAHIKVADEPAGLILLRIRRISRTCFSTSPATSRHSCGTKGTIHARQETFHPIEGCTGDLCCDPVCDEHLGGRPRAGAA